MKRGLTTYTGRSWPPYERSGQDRSSPEPQSGRDDCVMAVDLTSDRGKVAPQSVHSIIDCDRDVGLVLSRGNW
ncbi:hypothetical protein BRC77_10760 [Halobacteriales archaeon QH_8_64_26]|nr:MAG: hypothetical protein BRC77_10760 [Halobacteriales archaeon QH_8_64_26]